MKKVLSFILVLSMVLSSFGMAFAAPASDIAGHKNEEAILRLNSLGIVKGDDRGFAPDANITRAEFAVLLVRALGLEGSANIAKGDTPFTDVTVAAGYEWATGAINVASRLGYINGYGDGKFGPADNIRYEDAITLIVRALGYEPAAQAKGGYPVGYLVVAEQDLDITNKTNGVSGIAATRGTVFQMLDNALTESMMVQVGFGDKAEYKVDEDKTLLGQLGFKKVAKDRVVSFNADKNEIKFEKYGKAKVSKGFDFAEVYGVKTNAWLDSDDKVVVYTTAETPQYDATTGGAKIKLVSANKSYVVDSKATLLLDGEEVEAKNFTADYAKVVFNSDDEIIWAQGFTFDDTFVAGKVGEEVIYGVDKDELKVKDFTIVKEGKMLELEDIKAGDLVFYNKAEKYAVVHNDTKTGEIEKVYTDSFRFDGKNYDNNIVKYVDEDVVGQVDKDILASMKEEGKVTVFFNFAGKAVLIAGDRGVAKTNYFYGVVAEDTVKYQTRGDFSWTFDVLNQEGKVVKYDLKDSFVTDAKKYVGATWSTTNIAKNTVVKVTVDEDGVITKVERLQGTPITNVKVDEAYAAGYKLQDDAVVFSKEGNTAVKDYKVTKWSAVDFNEVKTGTIFVGEKGRVEAIFADTTDVKTTKHLGLVKDVRKVKSTKDIWDITILIEGVEKSFLTDGVVTTSDAIEDKIVEITLTSADKIKAIAVEPNKVSNLVVGKVSTSARTITGTVTGAVYADTVELVDGAVVYDATNEYKKIDLRDLNQNDTVEVYKVEANTNRFVKYVIRTAKAGSTPAPTQGSKFEGAFEVRGNAWVTIGGKDYIYAGSQTLTQLNTFVNKLVEFTLKTIDGETVVIDVKLP